MNKEIVQYYTDKFKDFKGNERSFCIALVSRPVKLAKEFRDVVAVLLFVMNRMSSRLRLGRKSHTTKLSIMAML